jgi:hypothetical protein
MKSSFLLTLALSVLTTNVALAQITSKTLEPKKTSYQKFSDRLKIGYFGVLTTPHFDDIGKGNWDNAAISPEFGNAPKGDQKNHDTWPTNIWHQVSFNYNFGAKLNFVVNPRFMTPLAHPVDMKAPEDRSFIMLDDLLVGFQGVIYASEDKKFNLWIRPGVRLPTSRASRNTGNRGAGSTTRQLDLSFSPTYDFNDTWQLGLFGQLRQWVIEDQYGFDRFRVITNPYIQYTIDDVSKVQVYYELIMETDRRAKPQGDRDPVFTDRWQNVLVGYGRDFTKKLNVMPFVGCFVNDKPITDKSLWAGAWISYSIK